MLHQHYYLYFPHLFPTQYVLWQVSLLAVFHEKVVIEVILNSISDFDNKLTFDFFDYIHLSKYLLYGGRALKNYDSLSVTFLLIDNFDSILASTSRSSSDNFRKSPTINKLKIVDCKSTNYFGIARMHL